MVPHRNLVHLGHAQDAWLTNAEVERVAQFASISFDASIWEMVMGLISTRGLAVLRTCFPSWLATWAGSTAHRPPNGTLRAVPPP
jgi:hypothetical protein